MSRKLISLLGVLFITAVLCTGLTYAAQKTYTYYYFDQDETADKIKDKATVIIKDLPEGRTSMARIAKEDRCQMEDTFILDKNYEVNEWTRKCAEEGTEYTARLENSQLIIQGTLKNEPLEKSIDLEGKALHVHPNYTLSKFALSGEPKMKFWTLRRDELSKLPMQAINKGTETIQVNGKDVEAIKIYYSITPKIREKYYNRDFYYRKSDGVFIKKVVPKGEIQELVAEE